jgi:hypothetical protein
MTCISIALLAFAMAFAACGDDDDDDGGNGDATATATAAATTPAGGDDSAEELAALTERLAQMNGADATEADQEFFLAHVTESFVLDIGTVESLEACEADVPACIGEALPNASVSASDVEIDGDESTAIIQTDIGPIGVRLTKDAEDWKLNGLFVPDDEIPSGVEVIDFEMAEFAFPSDLSSEAITSGNFALHAVNIGQQNHEIVLAPLPAEGALEDILADESFQPEPVFVKLPYHPGDESDIALPEPLDPGRYAFVCFFPDTTDPEGTPHAFLGMAREFTVE